MATNTKQTQFISADEAAAILGLTIKTLAQWRARRYGPSFFKAGGRVRYEKTVVEEWLSTQRVECY